MYSSSELTNLSSFITQEWSGLVAHFYHNLQKFPKDAKKFIADVRAYVLTKFGPIELISLLSEAYAGETVWQQYLGEMQHEFYKLSKANTPQTPHELNSSSAAPPGIPLREENAPEAERELNLSRDDALRAVRIARPGGGTISVAGQELYHETIHSLSGEGPWNHTHSAHVITLFYVRQGNEYFLVAMGWHTQSQRGESVYRIDRQISWFPTQLVGSGYTFQ